MSFVRSGLLLPLGIAFVSAHAQAQAPLAQVLPGTWDSTTYTSMQNGHIVGRLPLKPGSMVFTFSKDGAWHLHASEGTAAEHHGKYQLRGAELILRDADGSTYQDFKVDVLAAGKQLSMSDADVVLLLARVANPATK